MRISPTKHATFKARSSRAKLVEVTVIIMEMTREPMAVLVRSLMRPAPVSFELAMIENKTSDQDKESRKKSAIIFTKFAFATVVIVATVTRGDLRVPLHVVF